MTRITQRTYHFRQSEMLAQQGLHPVLARLYAARGVQQKEELSSDLKRLIPPDFLHHNDKAAHFLADAIQAHKKITIVADYDCDGATACAVGIRGLSMLGAQVNYIVPNRFEYGYGLTPEIVELTHRATQPDIIITVDNGIASIDGVEKAKQLGIEVLITDHHLPASTLPDAKVIVNPNQIACHFPSKNLAGVGVMFYVLLALRAELRKRHVFDLQTQPKLDSLLDLVALGTVADVVKLDSNNRILVSQGIKRMRAGQVHAGILALFRVSGREIFNASPFDLGFALGPRLNAAGRLADMSLGIECLITDNETKAWDIAQQLNKINAERKDIERDMQEVALLHLDDFNPKDNYTITLLDESMHQGVIGIVASRLKDKFHRPTITFAHADHQKIKGSGRSISGFHLRDALDLISKQNPHLIEKFGGHAMAAGLTLQASHFQAFQEAFEAVARRHLNDHDLEKVVETDGSLEADYFTLDFIQTLASQVWGQGFPAPLFCDDFIVVSQRILKDKHLKLQLQRGSIVYDAIWFNHADTLAEQSRVAYRLDANEYNGNTKVQLIVEYAESI